MPTRFGSGVYRMVPFGRPRAVPNSGGETTAGGVESPLSFDATSMTIGTPDVVEAVSSRATGLMVTVSVPVPQLSDGSHATTSMTTSPVRSLAGVYTSVPAGDRVTVPVPGGGVALTNVTASPSGSWATMSTVSVVLAGIVRSCDETNGGLFGGG